MSLSDPILWPPARENWKVITIATSVLLPHPEEGPHLHHASAHYYLLYTECKLLILLPKLPMNWMKPPTENKAVPC